MATSTSTAANALIISDALTEAETLMREAMRKLRSAQAAMQNEADTSEKVAPINSVLGALQLAVQATTIQSASWSGFAAARQ